MLYFLLLVCLTGSSFSLALFNQDDASDSLRSRLHNHDLMHSSSSAPIVNPEVKTAAKVAACATIGKGVCLGVTAAKYADKELTESSSQTK